MPSSAWAALCSRTRNRAEAGMRGRDMALLEVGSTISGPQAYSLFNPLEASGKARAAWSGRTANARFGKAYKGKPPDQIRWDRMRTEKPSSGSAKGSAMAAWRKLLRYSSLLKMFIAILPWLIRRDWRAR